MMLDVSTISAADIELGGSGLAGVVQWGTIPSNVTRIAFADTGSSFTAPELQFVPPTLPASITNMSMMFAGAHKFNSDISAWNTSKVTNMNIMFWNAYAFNQDLSSWCVTQIATAPSSFSSGTTAWTLPKPVWGTCPTP